MRYALLIGITYKNVENIKTLNAPPYDVMRIKDFLIKYLNYQSSNIRILLDNNPSYISPTRKNILYYFKNLIRIANKNKAKHIFFYYSGYGSYITNLNDIEDDNRDECIMSIDRILIRDNELRKIYQNINKNTKMDLLIDASHSGTVIETYNTYYPFKILTDIIIFNEPLYLFEYNIRINPRYKYLKNRQIAYLSSSQDNQNSIELNNKSSLLTNYFLFYVKKYYSDLINGFDFDFDDYLFINIYDELLKYNQIFSIGDNVKNDLNDNSNNDDPKNYSKYKFLRIIKSSYLIYNTLNKKIQHSLRKIDKKVIIKQKYNKKKILRKIRRKC